MKVAFESGTNGGWEGEGRGKKRVEERKREEGKKTAEMEGRKAPGVYTEGLAKKSIESWNRGKTRGCSRLLQLTRQVVPSSFNPFQPIKESSRRAMSPSGDWTTKSDWIICLQRPLRKPLYKVFLKRLLKPFGPPPPLPSFFHSAFEF